MMDVASWTIGAARLLRAGVAMLLAAGPMAALLVLPGRNRAAQRAIWGLVRWGFALVVRAHGRPEAGALLVANHVSWTDIVVLGGLVDGGFVAKSEVAGWPLIGRGAAAIGCVFVERERRRRAAGQAEAMAARLAQGQSLVLFAEGTTGDGDGVLPFRSSLFAAGEQVQPVTLAWRRRDGTPFGRAERRAFAWLGEDALRPHAIALARAGGARVDIHFEPVLSGGCRKSLAAASRAAIVARLDGYAATEKRTA